MTIFVICVGSSLLSKATDVTDICRETGWRVQAPCIITYILKLGRFSVSRLVIFPMANLTENNR